MDIGGARGAGRFRRAPQGGRRRAHRFLIVAASVELNKPRSTMLEDLGTYLVTHPSTDRVRRLLRFMGTGFVEFAFALEDLPDRARLAIPDLDLPVMKVAQFGQNALQITVDYPVAGAEHILLGVLRAMADDYGTLVLLEVHADLEGAPRLDVTVLETDFSSERTFALAEVDA
jgi:hypothetical protein